MARNSRKQRIRRFAPQFECCEGRTLLAADFSLDSLPDSVRQVAQEQLEQHRIIGISENSDGTYQIQTMEDVIVKYSENSRWRFINLREDLRAPLNVDPPGIDLSPRLPRLSHGIDVHEDLCLGLVSHLRVFLLERFGISL